MRRISLVQITPCVLVVGLLLAGCAAILSKPVQPTPTAEIVASMRPLAEEMAGVMGIRTSVITDGTNGDLKYAYYSAWKLYLPLIRKGAP